MTLPYDTLGSLGSAFYPTLLSKHHVLLEDGLVDSLWPPSR